MRSLINKTGKSKILKDKFALMTVGTFLILVSIIGFISIHQMKEVSAAFCQDDSDCSQQCVSDCTYQTGVCDTETNECVEADCSSGQTCYTDSDGCTSDQPECDSSNNCDNEKYYDGETCDGDGNCDEPYNQLEPDYSEESCDCYSGSRIYAWDNSYSSPDTSEDSCCIEGGADYSPDYQSWSDYEGTDRATCSYGHFYECKENEISDGEAFKVKDSSGDVMFQVDGNDGDVWVREGIYDEDLHGGDLPTPESGDWVVEDDSKDSDVAIVKDNNFYIKHRLLPDTTPFEIDDGLRIKNSDNDVVSIIDTNDDSTEWGKMVTKGEKGGGCGDWLD